MKKKKFFFKSKMDILKEGENYIKLFYKQNNFLLSFEQLYDHLEEFSINNGILDSNLLEYTHNIYDNISFCWWCESPANFICSCCLKDSYCSKECQKAAWNLAHKYDCCKEFWYVNIENKTYGPFTNEFMKGLNIDNDTLVSHHYDKKYKPLSEFVAHYCGKHFE